MSLSIADLGNICIHLSSFLHSSEIASSEEAGICSKDVARFLWCQAATARLANVPIWGPSGNSVIQQLLDSGVQGKAFLRELRLLRQAVFPPKSWCPAIQETSFSSLKAAQGAGLCPRLSSASPSFSSAFLSPFSLLGPLGLSFYCLRDSMCCRCCHTRRIRRARSQTLWFQWRQLPSPKPMILVAKE